MAALLFKMQLRLAHVRGSSQQAGAPPAKHAADAGAPWFLALSCGNSRDRELQIAGTRSWPCSTPLRFRCDCRHGRSASTCV